MATQKSKSDNVVPSSATPLVTANQLVTSPWLRFFTLLLARPGPIVPLVLIGSPFSFTASVRGTAFVVGGTVSAIQITRARVVFSTGQTSGNVPLAQGDTLVVTYSAAPTVSFVPG